MVDCVLTLTRLCVYMARTTGFESLIVVDRLEDTADGSCLPLDVPDPSSSSNSGDGDGDGDDDAHSAGNGGGARHRQIRDRRGAAAAPLVRFPHKAAVHGILA